MSACCACLVLKIEKTGNLESSSWHLMQVSAPFSVYAVAWLAAGGVVVSVGAVVTAFVAGAAGVDVSVGSATAFAAGVLAASSADRLFVASRLNRMSVTVQSTLLLFIILCSIAIVYF